MKRGLLTFLTFFCLLLSVQAQKVKYKDLFYLISGKQYEEVEPFLKQFLSDDKNADHPNANYQMAVIYDMKAEKADIFQESELVWMFSDSAMHFYARAKEYIDDKEVRKNDEYYEEFVKRDMRTGKESVKAFDIHFHIDDQVEKIQDRQKKVAEVNEKLLEVITTYNKARRYFIDLKTGTNSINDLLLRANLKTIGALDYLADTYDSFNTSFNQMRGMLSGIPHSGYSQQVKPESIEDFINDGESESHFLEDQISVWNYEEWAKTTKQKVIGDILPLKAELVKHDEKLEEIFEKAKSDSSVFTAALQSAKSSWDSGVLEKYDQNPLPERIFELRYAELDYLNTVLQDSEFDGSSDYSHRINLLHSEIDKIHILDSLASKLKNINLAERGRNYIDFFENRYKGLDGLKNYIDSKSNDAVAYLEDAQSKLEDLEFRNSFVVVNENRYFIDSLWFEQARDTLNYQLRHTNDHFSGGYVQKEEGIQGYVLEVTPQRVTNIYYEFSLDSAELGDNPNMIGQTDGSGQVYYVLLYGDTIHVPVETVFSEVAMEEPDSLDSASVTVDSTLIASHEPVNESTLESPAVEFKVVHPAILAKIYRVDGVSWVVPLHLKDIPYRIRINDLGEVIIDEIAEDEGRAQSMLVLSNKDGSVKMD